MKTKVLDRQSLLDVALISGGDMGSAMDIAQINNVGITDILRDGQLLETPAAHNDKIVQQYAAKDIKPATGLSDDDIETLSQEGIGYIGIEIDFLITE